MSKGSRQRPTDKEAFDQNFEHIFGKPDRYRNSEVGVICQHVWLYAGNDVEICAKCNEIQDVQK